MLSIVEPTQPTRQFNHGNVKRSPAHTETLALLRVAMNLWLPFIPDWCSNTSVSLQHLQKPPSPPFSCSWPLFKVVMSFKMLSPWVLQSRFMTQKCSCFLQKHFYGNKGNICLNWEYKSHASSAAYTGSITEHKLTLRQMGRKDMNDLTQMPLGIQKAPVSANFSFHFQIGKTTFLIKCYEFKAYMEIG